MDLSILDVPVRSVGLTGLLRSYDRGLLVFHNLDTLNKARRNQEFRDVCRRADLGVIDGQVLRLLVMMLWGRRVEKVSGSDFLPAFCSFHAGNPDVSVFLLGAGPGVAEEAGRALNVRAGRELVVGAHSPSFDLLDDEQEVNHVVELVNASGADTLAVALGAPKQELWMARHRHRMPGVRRLVAVGATLDFEAGRVRRAPAWMSRIGLEWAFRLVTEPRRLWRRYLVEGPAVVWAMAGSRAAHVIPLGVRSIQGEEGRAA
jgi:N-acetylglucosaminyldiphosphoundecaprenol N-acetyl-beta-D-mannosaminyltransferase